MSRVNAAEALQGMPWAITPGYLKVIHEIASRENDSIEAVEKRLGRPLSNTRIASQRGNVAIIPISGPIMRYANLMSRVSGATSIQELALDFQSALDNPDIETILFDVDSPGGAVSGVQEFADHVFAARGQKKIVAYASGMMASAAYWIASAADKIYASPTSIIGSIGVVTTLKKGDAEGEITIVSTKSPNKRPDLTTEGGVSSVTSLLDDLAEVFIGAVARNRAVTTDQVVNGFGQGDVFVGKQAVKTGLADSIGSYEALIESANKGKLNTTRKQISADTDLPIESTDTGEISMTTEEKTVLTKDGIAASNPDIAEAFRAEGFAKGKEAGFNDGLKAGANNERERIAGLEAAFDGFEHHASMLEQFKADGSTTGDMAAKHILSAERESLKGRQAALHADGNQAAAAAPQVNIHTPEAAETEASKTGAITMEEAEKIYASDPKVSKEFSSAETYFYYRANS